VSIDEGVPTRVGRLLLFKVIAAYVFSEFFWIMQVININIKKSIVQ